MAETFLHGIKLKEVDQGVRVFSRVDSSIIGVVGTATKGENNKPYVFTSYKEALTTLGAPTKVQGEDDQTATLIRAIYVMFEQGAGRIVAIKVADKTGVVGGVDEATNKFTGIKLLENIQKEPISADQAGNPIFLSDIPRILIAPGFSDDAAVSGALVKAAEALRAIAVIDCPNTGKTAAKEYAGTISSSYAYCCYPKIDFAGDVGVVGLSAVVAGVMARTDLEDGFWVSPSNKRINSMARLTRAVGWTLTDEASDANDLNTSGVTTVIRQDGFRVWGNLTRAGQDDSRFKWVSVRRIASAINETVVRNHFWAIDQNITRNFISTVLNSINAYMRSLEAQGAILGGKAYVDPKENQITDIKGGQVTFNFEFTPVYPANEIRFTSILTDTYIKELFT